MLMNTEVRVVNNRVFLLGLDELYRKSIKRHERDELPSRVPCFRGSYH